MSAIINDWRFHFYDFFFEVFWNYDFKNRSDDHNTMVDEKTHYYNDWRVPGIYLDPSCVVLTLSFSKLTM